MSLISLAFDLIRLKGHPIARYDYPFWQAVCLVVLIGLALGLDPSLGLPQPWSFGYGVVLSLTWFAFSIVFLRWWLKRGGRWQEHGSLGRVIAASWAIDITMGPLAWAGAAWFVLLVVWLYALAIMANALRHATGVNLGYCAGGMVLAFMLYLLGLMIVVVLVGVGLGVMGWTPEVG